MEEMIKLLIGIGMLVLGFFLGGFLAKKTKDELKSGQKWFRIIVILGLIGGVVGLVLGNDFLFFSFLFITVVTSRSLKNRAKRG